MANARRNTRVAPQSKGKLPRFRIAKRLSETISSRINLGDELPVSQLLKIGWTVFLIIIYIFFQHNYDSLIRKIVNARTNMEEMRASYVTHQAKFMYASKQSEVTRKLNDEEIDKNLIPPTKLEVRP